MIGLYSGKARAPSASALCLLAGMWLSAAAAISPARADDSVAMELNHPAIMTPRAKGGLFNSIARAGDRLVAVGEQGRIMLSDDNGKSWRQVETPTSVTLTQARFATPLDGWAVGQMGIVLHTADGGLTWNKQYDDIEAAAEMLRAAKASAAAQPNNTVAQANLQAAQIMVQGGPNVPFLTVLPLSQKNLLIAGAFGMAFSSTDGGASWQSIAADISNPNGLHIYDLIENQGGLIGVGEQGYVIQGTFNGMFTPLTSPIPGTFFGALTAPDQSLIAFGLQGGILRSTDKGKTWTQPASNVGVGIDSGIVLQNGNILLGDVAGDLLVSADNGVTFSVSQAGKPVTALGQAADGSIIIGGIGGLMRISSASLNSGS